MSEDGPSRITTLLGELRQGRETARDELVTLVYPELRRIAAHYIRQGSGPITHYERPASSTRCTYDYSVRRKMDWQSRAHLFAAVAREMRHILVDRARARDAQKRPDHRLEISLSDVGALVVSSERDEDVVALDEALSRLEAIDPRAGRVVELRYFTGLNEREAAEALGASPSTLKRHWNFAKAWFFDQLRSDASP